MQDDEQDYEENETERKRREQRTAKFAIFCRKIRMEIAANPGVTTAELKQKMGGRYDMALSKMQGMGIIKGETAFNQQLGTTWFVIPQ